MARKRKSPTMSPALKSELRAEQRESAPELDAEVRALASFLTTEGIDCGKHSNAELAHLILDFLVRRERH